MSKKNTKAAKKARHQALLEAEQREEQEREEKRAKNAKRKERQQAAMSVDTTENGPMPAKRRRLMPKEMKTKSLLGDEDDEPRFATVGPAEAMEGVESTEEPKPNNVIVTLGFDELKSMSKMSNSSKAAMAARIRTNNRLKRVRSKSKTASEAESYSMQI
eukprot:TRINITY_DN229_c0_g1_i1.p1 TRINITY_DN229_c0_g1~~TRINITY_DN229_c0_g1_i1.p1  ORF type:complete len:160 (+),score=34.53 TRINITY_DN229_c0_g1_i1:290-769(+)